MIKHIVFDIGNIILKGHVSDVVDNDKELSFGDKELIKEVVFNGCTICDYKPFTYKEYYQLIDHKVPDYLKEKAQYLLFNSFKLRGINENVIALMRTLKSHGYNIYILSDNSIETTTYLRSQGFASCVDGWCVSYMYDETKANTNLFEIFFDEFDLDPDECYFIDDRKDNIDEALEHGMRGFNLDWENNSFSDLIRDMQRKNIVK